MKTQAVNRALSSLIAMAVTVLITAGCGHLSDDSLNTQPDRTSSAHSKAEPFVPAADGSNYLEPPFREIADEDMAQAAEELEPSYNIWQKLSVPTWVMNDGSTWFIVDCYHNLVLYSNDNYAMGQPLTKWQVLSSDITQAHTIAGDGEVYLIDDTENNRVFVYNKVGGKFLHTQTFWDTGDRPHYTVYDADTDSFYVLSSRTGELFVFRRALGTADIYLTEIRSIPRLKDIYIRSFTISDDRIYFVSGIPSAENPSYSPAILCCDLATLDILEEYPVPDSIAGMSQLFSPIADFWLVTVSTDASGNQDAAALLKVSSLNDLSSGNYENIYSKYFVGGGTPYFINRVGSSYYLTEHRLEDHAVWRFSINGRGDITDVESVY